MTREQKELAIQPDFFEILFCTKLHQAATEKNLHVIHQTLYLAYEREKGSMMMTTTTTMNMMMT